MQHYKLYGSLTFFTISWIIIQQYHEARAFPEVNCSTLQYYQIEQIDKECMKNFYKIFHETCIYISPLYLQKRSQCINTGTFIVRKHDRTVFRCLVFLTPFGILMIISITFLFEIEPPKMENKCTNNHEVMNCTGLNLTSIPLDMKSDIQWFYLNGNQLNEDSIDVLSFYGLSINYLNLGNNQIENLKLSQFPRLYSLAVLSLRNNKMKKLELNVLDHPFLDSLDLSHNCIGNLTAKTFINPTPHQQKFYSSNPLSIPLQSLHLDNNHIEGIENDTFDGFTNLKILDLSNNRIAVLTSAMFYHLSSLKQLYLQNSRIDAIQADAFNGLENLLELNLSNNSLRTLEQYMFKHLTNLRDLLLQNNQISSIENCSWCGLEQLQLLNLSKNFLQTLEPDMFKQLTNLNDLLLQSNQISAIEDCSWCGLQQLRLLNLTYNNLSKLMPNMMKNLSSLVYLDLSQNQIIQIEENAFNGLGVLMNLNMSGNRLTNLTKNMFFGLEKLIDLSLSHNNISTIEADTFHETGYQNEIGQMTVVIEGTIEVANLTTRWQLSLNLENNSMDTMKDLISEREYHEDWDLSSVMTLRLSHNKLTNLKVEDFHNLSNALWYFYADHNLIESIEMNTFSSLRSLIELDLSYNKLTTLMANTFPTAATLFKNLHLQFNQISQIENFTFDELPHMTLLNLSNNRITELRSYHFQRSENRCDIYIERKNSYEALDFLTFDFPLERVDLNNNSIAKWTNVFKCYPFLRELHLQDNRIEIIEDHSFNGSYFLTYLDLSNNKIQQLTDNTFYGLKKLSYLKLTNNNIGETEGYPFKTNIHLQKLETDEFRFCCLVKNTTNCTPAADQFSSCKDLMANTLLGTSIWILGIIAIFNNVYVIILRSQNKKDAFKVHSFLIKNLALSDLFMGIYLLIIASADWYYKDIYHLHDFYWRTSFMCNFAGFMSAFSSELTVFTLTVVTLDRLLATVFPFRVQRREMKTVRSLITAGWIVAAAIAIIPLPIFRIPYFQSEERYGFYGRSGVCLALHLTDDKPAGWMYSVFVFIGLNTMSFLLITIGYILMYWSVGKTHMTVPTNNPFPSVDLAFRMTLLVSADAACWMPIIILGIRSIFGHSMSPEVYAWIAVFVLPLNAALNPILYTIVSLSKINLRSPFYVKKKIQQCSCKSMSTQNTDV